MAGVLSLSIPYFYLAHVMLVAIRVGATLLFAPIWGHPGIPQTMRILMVFAIAAAIASVTPFNAQAYTNPGAVIPGEILIGMLLSMSIRIAVAGLHLGGQLMSYYMGFSMVQSIDPSTQNRSTLLSGFLTMLGFMMILTTDQHHVMLRALWKSYETFPMGTMLRTGQWFETLMATSAEMFAIGWKIALPVFIATFLVDLTVGLVSRIQPQISTMVVTAPLKLLVGMMALGASFAYLPRVLGSVIETVILKK